MSERGWTRWSGLGIIVGAVVLFYANVFAASTFMFVFRSGWSNRVGEVALIGGTVVTAALVLFGLYACTGRLDKRRVRLPR